MDKEMIIRLKAVYDEAGFEDLLKELFLIVSEDSISQKSAEKLAKCFFDITAGGGDYFDAIVADYFEFAYQKFPKSKILKKYLIDVYGVLVDNQISGDYLHRMEQLIGKKPKNEDVARRKVDMLESQYSKDLLVRGMEPDWDKCLKNVHKIEEIFNWYPKNEYIALRFSEALEKLTNKQDIEACKITVERLEKLFEHTQINLFSNTDWIVTRLTHSLSNLSIKQTEQDAQKTIDRIEEIVNMFPDKAGILHLAYALKAFSKYKKGKEKQQIISRLMEISAYWEPAARMAYCVENNIKEYWE
jgi:hypothetical protein